MEKANGDHRMHLLRYVQKTEGNANTILQGLAYASSEILNITLFTCIHAAWFHTKTHKERNYRNSSGMAAETPASGKKKSIKCNLYSLGTWSFISLSSLSIYHLLLLFLVFSFVLPPLALSLLFHSCHPLHCQPPARGATAHLPLYLALFPGKKQDNRLAKGPPSCKGTSGEMRVMEQKVQRRPLLWAEGDAWWRTVLYSLAVLPVPSHSNKAETQGRCLNCSFVGKNILSVNVTGLSMIERERHRYSLPLVYFFSTSHISSALPNLHSGTLPQRLQFKRLCLQ